MKFNKPAARNPLPSGDLRVDSMVHFGNYFFSFGLLEGFGSEVGVFEYKFAEHERPVTPEFSFYHPEDGSESRVRFLHLFWVNDGYRVMVGPNCPAVVTPKDDRKNGSGPRFAITDLLDSNFEVLLAALDAMESRDVWSNRLVLEMVKRCSLDDRTGYFAVALDRVGWQTLDTEVAKILARKSGENTVREYLNFQCLCISNMDVRYLPSELKAKFTELVGDLDLTENDRSLAHAVIRQLARFDSDRACEFAHSVITTLTYDREELAICLRHCYPKNSQWWIHHALVNPGLGPEQAADALNCAGTAAATQGQAALALLSYEAALMVDPDARSVAWNAGLLCAGLGEVETAGGFFKRVGRHYPNDSLSTCWPHVRGTPWPVAPMNMECYVLPAGVTRWPRITVITPSYNQGCFIEETILSVLNQGYPNLQYIVVDGNSTDDTRQVLERYRDRFDHLIIESDKGQTEAINKGLRLSEGDLVAWINSDDMYAPGTFHTAALKWLENQADVIAGICIEHIDRRLMLFNRPAATNSEFNPPQLARIFKYWLKGYYFYQPEVFFSKRILDVVGHLDESLYYSMDYDLWMRFAKAGAILNVVDWPFAFFRKHEAQKTSNLVECVEEQARVRSRHYTLVPDDECRHRIQRKLDFLKQKKGATVGILTKRLGKIFSKSIQRELAQFCSVDGLTCYLGDDETDPRIAGADVVILLAHVLSDVKTIGYLREVNPDRLIAAWFWDNHHHLFENQEAAEAVDVVLPGHAIYGEYLRNDQSLYGGHVPLCVTQWSRQEAEAWFAESGSGPRSAELYGGFVEYTFEPARTEFLQKVMEIVPGHSLSILSEANLHAYFGRSENERFVEWCGYQTSLVLPLRKDLSQRIFDALLAGQIPLVPEEIADLDQVVSRELQESLPILRFRMNDPSSVVAAHRKALECFASMGAAGTIARHRHALENHMFSSRINTILHSLGTSAFIPNNASAVLMNSRSHEAETVVTGHRVLLQLPAFGPEGLAISLHVSANTAGVETFLALHSKSNDIVLYLGILWTEGEVILSKCTAGDWSDKITQRVSLTGGKARIGVTIRPTVITVEIDGVRLIDWPLEVFFTQVISLHGSGSWIVESAEISDVGLSIPESVLPDLPVENDLLASPQDDLIFDFGMHNGDDADFYLMKGFRVISVDANPTQCSTAAIRFKQALESNRLTVCNIGVAPVRGDLTFYVNKEISEWSSFDRDIASRGHPVVEVKVRTARPEDFFRAFGVPYYCKIDIEGFDRLVVDGIVKLPVKPRYVSFENGELRDFEALVTAGYNAFQLVDQSKVAEVKLPEPSAEGASIRHTFPSGSSGPFGRDLEGGWIGVEEMRTRLTAHHRDLAARSERGYDWWDLHACHQDA